MEKEMTGSAQGDAEGLGLLSLWENALKGGLLSFEMGEIVLIVDHL